MQCYGIGVYGCLIGSLVFNDDVPADTSSRMSFEVYMAIFSFSATFSTENDQTVLPRANG